MWFSTGKQRREYRLKKAPPVLSAFWSWLEELTGYDKGTKMMKMATPKAARQEVPATTVRQINRKKRRTPAR
jgi:hypothetical protein